MHFSKIESYEELEDFFANHIKGWHPERLAFLSLYIMAIIKVRSVNSSEVSKALNPKTKRDSNQRRIENFFSKQEMNYEEIALLILYIIPVRKYKLIIDRTNWKYGSSDINIFMLCVKYKGIGIPVYWTCLNKRGNSNTSERIELLDAYIAIFGKRKVSYLLADREFVGEEWFTYLSKNKIPFFIRIKECFYIHDFEAKIVAKFFFSSLKAGVYKDGKVCGVKLNIVGRRLSKKEKEQEEEDLLIVATNEKVNNPTETLKIYKERWEIETLFRAYKKKGFNLEETHITDSDRIRKLVALLSLALVWCYKVGVKYDTCYKSIEIKKHGYKQCSFVKYGLDLMGEIILNLPYKMEQFSNLIILFTMNGFENSISRVLNNSE